MTFVHLSMLQDRSAPSFSNGTYRFLIILDSSAALGEIATQRLTQLRVPLTFIFHTWFLRCSFIVLFCVLLPDHHHRHRYQMTQTQLRWALPGLLKT